MKNIGNFIQAQDKAAWLEVVGNCFFDLATQKANNNQVFNIAVSGGTTPIALFEYLVVNDNAQKLNWNKVNIFWVDERWVDETDEQSNYGIAKNILSKTKANLFPIITSLSQAHQQIVQYKASLNQHIQIVNHFPQFDLIILGMGNDGHTASLFPKTQACEEFNGWVVINEVPQLQTKRITLTFPVIKNAKNLWVLFSGDDKLKLVQHMFFDKNYNYPIEELFRQPLHLKWFYY